MKIKTRVLSLIQKSLKLSMTNIWRNKVLSLATIFVTATIIFIFNIILSINFIAQNAITDLNKKVDLTVYLKETTTYEDVQFLTSELSTINGIEAINYVSKQDALTQINSTHPDISLAFEKYDLGNPLPASLNITTSHPKYHQVIADFLRQKRYQQYLSTIITNDTTDSSGIITSVSKNLLELTNFTRQIIFWLILTFILGGALIIMNALQITIFSRKNEISVMKLVGASNWFIRAPFITESIIYGILAVILSFIMLLILATNIHLTIPMNYFFGELIATILLSIFSSVIAIHEYIKRDLLEN